MQIYNGKGDGNGGKITRFVSLTQDLQIYDKDSVSNFCGGAMEDSWAMIVTPRKCFDPIPSNVTQAPYISLHRCK